MATQTITQHWQLDKCTTALYFSIFLSISIQTGSAMEFMGMKWLENAGILNLILALAIPVLVVAITGPYWAHDSRKKAIVQIAAAIVTSIVTIYIALDFLRYNDYFGMPPAMQFGYYLVYEHYPIMVQLAMVVTMIVISAPDAFHSSIGTSVGKADVLISAILLIMPAWLITLAFLSSGFFWSMLVETACSFIYIVVKASTIITRLRDVPGANMDIIHEGKPSIKNGRNGTLHVFKVALIFVLIMLELYGTMSILNQVLVRPNYVPLWLQFFPYFFLGGITWGIVYGLSKSRFSMVIASTAILLVNAALLASSSNGYIVFSTTSVVLCGFSLSGLLLGGMLYMTNMATGRFSQVVWRTVSLFFMVGGLLYGLIDYSGIFSINSWRNALIYSAASLIVFFILFALKNKNGFWNKGKRELLERFRDFFSPATNPATIPAGRVRSKLASSIMIAGIIACMAFIGTGMIVAGQTSFTEQVIGTHGGDYYLWFADATRSVDANYMPNLPACPVNSTLHISMARGEHYGFQVIFSPWNINNLNVWSFAPVGDLTNNLTAAIIGSGNITVYNVEYIPQLSNQFADQLLPFHHLDTSVKISGQRNYPFYVDVFVPANNVTKPGLYQTKFLFHCEDYHQHLPGETDQYNSRDVIFTLQVTLLNFTIPTQHHIGTEIIWGIPETAAWENFYVDHRLDWNFGISPVKSYNLTPGHLSLVFNFPTYFAALDPLLQGGMQYFPISWQAGGLNWGTLFIDNATETLLSWYLGNMTAQLSNRTVRGMSYLNHAYYFIIDEPGPQIYANVTRIAKTIHKYAPSLRIMETMDNDLSTYNDTFLQEVDIYCQHIHDWVPSSYYPRNSKAVGMPARINDFLATYNGTRQKELWVYNTGNGFPIPDTYLYDSGIMERISFWMYWIYGIKGWLYWTFNWGMDRADGYGYGGWGEGTLVGYGENNTPIGSLRLENVLHGIQDYECFWLLNHSCTVLEQNGKSSEAAAGRALLERANQLFNQPEYLQHFATSTSNPEPYATSYDPHAAPYLQLREEVGAELGRLFSLGLL
ncbi:MAG TPA: glycoside hydrolase domain-containing protein [Candidatus Lokiarchaeia archaeon]|nr:glycoside hydrolase domain-containing protein [Candidatus Lokiarchaeia archaeon]